MILKKKENVNKNNNNEIDLAEINRMQQTQFARLNRLQEKLNLFCEDLSLGHLTQQIKPLNVSNTSKANAKTGAVSTSSSTVSRCSTKINVI